MNAADQTDATWREPKSLETGMTILIRRPTGRLWWRFWRPKYETEVRRVEKVAGRVIWLDDLSTVALPTRIYP